MSHILPVNGGYGTHSVWLPSDLANLVFWVRGDSITEADGADVTQWDDESGNSMHFTGSAGVTGKRKDGAINGQTALLFDGVDDVMITPTLSPVITAPYHLFAVFKCLDLAVSKHILRGQGAGTGRIFQHDADTLRWQVSGSVNFNDNYDDGSWEWAEAFGGTSADSNIIVDQNDGVGAVTAGTPPTVYRIAHDAASDYTNLEIAEIILVNSQVTDVSGAGNELTNLRAYITAKYGLPTK